MPPQSTFQSARTKVQLKLCISRLKLLQSKKAAQNQASRREIAVLIERGKVESARVRVELVIREDFMVEALELLEVTCDLLQARFGMLEQTKTGLLDPSIAEACASIVYAAPRCEVRELLIVPCLIVSQVGSCGNCWPVDWDGNSTRMHRTIPMVS
jgi:vacuolar protein sorting-associated protein IST1